MIDLGLGKNHYSTPKIIFTHFHPANIGWTFMEENGNKIFVFPNAKYYSSKAEFDFWTF